ncbi:peptide ABC transporter substrate-binding protein [Alicyclobacillus cellulosilyticus]|uniref:Peptide ABC transporter substrate-binding protein n=1 Tax=Alicyclobacillus cellulosilyticus TaxID=1003997 RepID=A0A917KG39_9BACL|nr:ABC transporter substrate-binding protein [Alicyclobacillus cellulosilyticus]GGJ11884.1 peptide ABC transporter substrate-binding protein [Alicyclobacillus cellulosilyticus]
MYESLVQVAYKSVQFKVAPALATDWNESKDGKTWTFHIRKGVTFWNGDPVTAQSFVDEMQRILTPKTKSPFETYFDPLIVGSTAYHNGKANKISGLTTPDKYTLVVHLTQPEPFFLQVVSQFWHAVDMKFIQKVGDTAFDSTQAMGTGPFMLKSKTPNQYVLVRNPHYWQKDRYGNRLPYLNQVTITETKNPQLIGMHFQEGQTALLGNSTVGIPPAVYPQFISDPNLKKDLVTRALNAVRYLGMNVKTKPFDNVLVRRALEYAINKQKVLQLVNGRGTIADQPLPPSIDGRVPNLSQYVDYKYDPAKAKQLLKQAGFAKGFTTTLWYENTPTQQKIAESIQNDLKQIGVTVNLRPVEWDTLLNLNASGKTPLFLLGWIQDFPDPSDFLNTLFNTNEQPQNNSTLYSNKQVDAWLNKAQFDTNQVERMKLYRQVTIQVMKDAPWVPLFYDTAVYAVQPWVKNYFLNPNYPFDPLQYIWVAPH